MVVASVETVTFSDYIIDLSEPGDRAIEPGATTTLTFIVSNIERQILGSLNLALIWVGMTMAKKGL